MTYNGGQSKYTYEDHLDFSGYTGTIQAWIRMDTPPLAEYSYTIDATDTKHYHFIDSSTYFPTSWKWYVDGILVSQAEAFTYVFSAAGDYIVTLVASNGAGSTEKNKLITVV
ncbi:MAG: PKD domain-containing protein [Candidatus Altiarchaeales archaeon]|nr:PKD domain-containing protein [Candidatus Altiarchaeales archaeon]